MGRLARSSRQRNLVDALNEEWERLATQQSGTVAGWAEAHLEFRCCRTLPDVLTAVRLDPDAALLVLILRCQAGDQLAGRVVVQAMLGKVVRMASADRVAGVDDFVGVLWLRICGYPVRARPRQVAANLALDTLKAVHQQTRGPQAVRVSPYPPTAALEELSTRTWRRDATDPAAGVSELSARRVLAAAERLGVLDRGTSEVLHSVYVEGLSGRAAAERHSRSAGAIRQHCSTAVRRLARHAELLMEAA